MTIELKSLTISRDGKTILDDASLLLPTKGLFIFARKEKEDFGILSGVLSGLVKPDSGEIAINRENLTKYSEVELDTYRRNLFDYLSACPKFQTALNTLENVEYPLWLKGTKTNSKEEAVKALERVGASSDRKNNTCLLSADRQRKVSLARLIVKSPDLILADDPYACNLSEETAEFILSQLKELSKTKLVIIGSLKHSFLVSSNPSAVLLCDGKTSKVCLVNPVSSDKEYTQKKEEKLTLPHVFHLAYRHLLVSPALFLTSFLLSVFSLTLLGYTITLTTQTKNRVQAASILSQGDDYLSLKNKKNQLSPDQGCYFTEENVNEVSKLLNLPVSGVMNRDDISIHCYFDGKKVLPDFADLKTPSIQSYYWSNTDYFCSIPATDSLPKNYKLLSGHIPNKENEIMLTDFQFERINDCLGIQNTYDSVLNRQIAFVNPYFQICPDLTIAGVLDTAYDADDYAAYKEYCLKGTKPETVNAEAKQQKARLENLKSESYINLYFVSQNISDRLKSNSVLSVGAESSATFLLDGQEILPDLIRPYRLNCLDQAKRQYVSLFDGLDFTGSDFLCLSLGSYIRATKEKNPALKEISTITIPKRFLNKASKSDYVYAGTAEEFFTDFLSIPIRYYSLDHYEEAFENKEFDIVRYSKEYYEKAGEEVPNDIPDKDKAEIYSLYLAPLLENGTPDYSSEKALSVFYGLTTKAKERLDYYLSLYSDSIFQYRNFSYRYPVSGRNKEETISLSLSGLTALESSSITPLRQKETVSKIVPGTGIYSRLLIPTGADKSKIKSVVSKEGQEYSKDTYFTINNASAMVYGTMEKVKKYTILFSILSAICLVPALFLLYKLFGRTTIGLMNDLSLQQSLGTTKKDIGKQIFFQSGIRFLSLFMFAFFLLFALSFAIRHFLVSEYSQFAFVLPGLLQTILLFFVSLILVFAPALPSLLKLKKWLRQGQK